jgi:plastocyanin
MTKKIIVAIIIAVVVILGSYSLLNGPTMPPQENNLEPKAEAPVENVVTYTDAVFSPNPLTIKVGGTVTFKNESSRSMWTASAFHPTHREYPTTGGCLGSTFDACRGVQPGDSWSFQFDIAGNWRYHDHLNPSSFGAIIVE